MLLLIDNYDSFTYNLYHYMGELGAKTTVCRNDALTVDDIVEMRPQAIVLSPGPSDPDHAGICLETIARCAGHIPIFGVCLGHQSIGQAFGGRVVRAPVPMHGKISEISHCNTDLFENLPSPFEATRYHSLMVDLATLPDCLEVTARSDDGVIQGLKHRTLPVYGVQFHPESIATENGHALLANFLKLAAATGGPH